MGNPGTVLPPNGGDGRTPTDDEVTTRNNANNVVDPANQSNYGDILNQLVTQMDTRYAPMAQSTLPPQYYFPNMAAQDVAVGQMSSPMGSMTLFSPGAPLIPYSIWDAVQQQETQARKEYLKELEKGLGDVEYLHTVNPNYDRQFVQAQINTYDGIRSNLMDKVNSGEITMGQARTMATSEFAKINAQFESHKSMSDSAYDEALVVVTADPRLNYHSPETVSAAQDFIDQMWKLDTHESPEDMYEALSNLRTNLIGAIGLEEASKEWRRVAGLNIETMPALNRIYMQHGDNYVLAQSDIQKLLEQVKLKGIDAFITAEEGTDEYNAQKEQLYGSIKTDWESNYGAKWRENKSSAPSFDEYKEYVISHTQAGLEREIQTLSNSGSWTDYAIRKREREDLSIKSGYIEQETSWGATAKTWTLPDNKAYNFNGGSFTDVWGKNGEFLGSKNLSGGRVVEYGEVDLPNGKKEDYATVFVPTKISAWESGGDATNLKGRSSSKSEGTYYLIPLGQLSTTIAHGDIITNRIPVDVNIATQSSVPGWVISETGTRPSGNIESGVPSQMTGGATTTTPYIPSSGTPRTGLTGAATL